MSFVDRISGTQSENSGTFRPQLTSLIDVMTILLVFLIKSFSVEGNLVTPSPDLELPVSTAEKTPRPVCNIEITRQAVNTEDGLIAGIDEIMQSDSLMIPTLFDWMILQKSELSDSTAAAEVMIQADKEVEFDIVKRVMFTCSKAGFEDFSVLVLEEDS